MWPFLALASCYDRISSSKKCSRNSVLLSQISGSKSIADGVCGLSPCSGKFSHISLVFVPHSTTLQILSCRPYTQARHIMSEDMFVALHLKIPIIMESTFLQQCSPDTSLGTNGTKIWKTLFLCMYDYFLEWSLSFTPMDHIWNLSILQFFEEVIWAHTEYYTIFTHSQNFKRVLVAEKLWDFTGSLALP